MSCIDPLGGYRQRPPSISTAVFLIYYAHAMCLYGPEVERAEVAAITRRLPSCCVVDPGTIQQDAGKGDDDGMRYLLRVIDCCDTLVFSRLLGKVTAGVGLEVNHALARRIPVYELGDGTVSQVAARVEFLSREETLAQYRPLAQLPCAIGTGPSQYSKGVKGSPSLRLPIRSDTMP